MDLPTAIHKSLTGFVCGLFGLIPLLGLPAAVYSLLCWFSVWSRHRGQWNPGARYLDAGAVLALLGVLISALLLSAAVLLQ